MLGEKLRELRTELNLNMKQASEKLGISYTTYVGYEKNEREPNSETLIKLADFYKKQAAIQKQLLHCLNNKTI